MEQERYEEFSVAKVKGFPDKFAFAHHLYFNNPPRGGFAKILADLSWDRLAGYLEGAAFGKTKEIFYMYDGISETVRSGFFPDLEFENFENSQLAELLNSSGLTERFSVEDFKRV